MIWLVRVIDYLQYVAPFATLWFAAPVLVVITWLLTVRICKWQNDKWMHRYGDAELGKRIDSLTERLKEKEDRVRELEARVRSLRALIRAALQPNSRVAQILTGMEDLEEIK